MQIDLYNGRKMVAVVVQNKYPTFYTIQVYIKGRQTAMLPGSRLTLTVLDDKPIPMYLNKETTHYQAMNRTQKSLNTYRTYMKHICPQHLPPRCPWVISQLQYSSQPLGSRAATCYVKRYTVSWTACMRWVVNTGCMLKYST